ncbi:Hypothetical protein D9617_8g051930 [Elsinoe fawcettii]|nr:Hypothetical protein D9617_8g051930 [Elsinoe fawcettii]
MSTLALISRAGVYASRTVCNDVTNEYFGRILVNTWVARLKETRTTSRIYCFGYELALASCVSPHIITDVVLETCRMRGLDVEDDDNRKQSGDVVHEENSKTGANKRLELLETPIAGAASSSTTTATVQEQDKRKCVPSRHHQCRWSQETS